MKCSPLFAPIPVDAWRSEIQLSSGIIIMLFLLSDEVHIMLNEAIFKNTYTHKYIFSGNAFFLMHPLKSGKCMRSR